MIMKIAQAGTLESNDIVITIAPGALGSGINIELTSIVMAQYGEAIERTITAALAEQNVSDVYVKAVDRGALDCTIQARVLAALARAGCEIKEGEQ